MFSLLPGAYKKGRDADAFSTFLVACFTAASDKTLLVMNACASAGIEIKVPDEHVDTIVNHFSDSTECSTDQLIDFLKFTTMTETTRKAITVINAGQKRKLEHANAIYANVSTVLDEVKAQIESFKHKRP